MAFPPSSTKLPRRWKESAKLIYREEKGGLRKLDRILLPQNRTVEWLLI
jgi:hypothetical protein